MRIALDGSHWATPGGVRSLLENLLPALVAAEPDLDLRVLMRGSTARCADTLPPGVTPVPVPWPRRLLDRLENHLAWPTVERFTGPVDSVHGTHFALPRARPEVPAILHVHDVAYLKRPDLYADDSGNRYGYEYLLRHSVRRADRIIAISHATKADLVEVTDVDPDRVWVSGLGTDARFSPASPAEQAGARSTLGIEGAFVIYPVGTFTPRKNVEGALEAFAHAFPDPLDRPTLLLTGPKELPARIEARIATLGLTGSVAGRSVRYPDDLRALYSCALFGLYPSLYEGFGLPPLEAMACGLPMLVSNRTSCPEVVGDAALLCDPDDLDALVDGLRALATDAKLRADLRTRGLARAGDPAFRWDRVARQVLAAHRDDRVAFEAETDPLVPAATPDLALEH